MDDSFQFIIESPQHSQGHKKRPRLVTSCDNCRLKKIKCLQPSPETKCEACKTAKIPCRFRDRERYFAERSRAIAGPNANSAYMAEPKVEPSSSLDAFSVASGSSSPSMSSHSNPRSTSHSPKASGMVSADVESNGRYTSYPPDSRRSTESSHRHSNSSSISSFHSSRSDHPTGYNSYLGPGSSQLLHQTHTRSTSGPHDSRHIHLFDSDHPELPHASVMQQFIPIFFERFGSEFTFLSYQLVMGDFWERSLPPLIANCIAAMASRYSTLPELVARGLHNVSDAYLENAKTVLNSVAHIPSIETLHGLILLSWAEYKSNKIPSFRLYCQAAMRMAMDLGISDQNTIQVHADERERDRRRSTWASIVQLHMTSSSYR
ncbi:hypothetical protein BDQ12DRAFT_673081 [Crucibulum laeve]|uniref:Zn(2)-C6 fungal-type domain-containing protein n=1 Tax=Crucibulum laeve TaxID=68775 RepID=A0A5C3MKN9_9AGAR|nr:hypothetical protein BDQ12DRAFT_673081 [Crucibulum laeve]